jgi:hypothetical protein
MGGGSKEVMAFVKRDACPEPAEGASRCAEYHSASRHLLVYHYPKMNLCVISV